MKRTGLWFIAAISSIVLSACGATVAGGDAGDSGADGSTDVVVDHNAMCPTDLSSIQEGAACTGEGLSCGTCSDPCQFCNLWSCTSGRWSHIEVFPGQCDGGTPPDVPPIDSGNTMQSCGDSTCAAGETCVRTIRTGGACRAPEDGGCGPGERLAGGCCVFYQESLVCRTTPAACNGAVTCGCAASLCEESQCPCENSSDGTLQCGCFFP